MNKFWACWNVISNLVWRQHRHNVTYRYLDVNEYINNCHFTMTCIDLEFDFNTYWITNAPGLASIPIMKPLCDVHLPLWRSSIVVLVSPNVILTSSNVILKSSNVILKSSNAILKSLMSFWSHCTSFWHQLKSFWHPLTSLWSHLMPPNVTLTSAYVTLTSANVILTSLTVVFMTLPRWVMFLLAFSLASFILCCADIFDGKWFFCEIFF